MFKIKKEMNYKWGSAASVPKILKSSFLVSIKFCMKQEILVEYQDKIENFHKWRPPPPPPKILKSSFIIRF